MELKTWLMIVRILNCISAGLLIGFQIWYLIQLLTQKRMFYGFLLRIWAPIFLIFLGFLIISSQFKYEKIVQNFKFLQWLPGLALYNLFMASIVAFEFSTLSQTYICLDCRISVILASIFIGISLIFLIVNCFKPIGSRGLLSQESGIVV